MRTFSKKFFRLIAKNFVSSTFLVTFWSHEEKIGNFEFVQRVNFLFTNSWRTNGKNYLFTFDNSCDMICNSKFFKDFVITGSHEGLCTLCNRLPKYIRSKSSAPELPQFFPRFHLWRHSSNYARYKINPWTKETWLALRYSIWSHSWVSDSLVFTKKTSYTFLYKQ